MSSNKPWYYLYNKQVDNESYGKRKKRETRANNLTSNPSGYVVIYIRTDSVRNNTVGYQDQLDKIIKIITTNKYEPIATYDDNCFGNETNRQGLSKALKSLEGGDVFMFYSLSHLSTDATQCLNIINYIDSIGASAVSSMEKINNKSPVGKFILTAKTAFNQYEHQMETHTVDYNFMPPTIVLPKPTLPTIDLPSNRPLLKQRLVPYGYRYDIASQRLVKNKHQLRNIQNIIYMKEQLNVSFGEISDHLNELGVFPGTQECWTKKLVTSVYYIYSINDQTNIKDESLIELKKSIILNIVPKVTVINKPIVLNITNTISD